MKCAVCGKDGLREALGEATTLVLSSSSGLDQRMDLCRTHMAEWAYRAGKLLHEMKREWEAY